MFFPEGQVRVFVYGEPVNMRFSFDGLYALVKTPHGDESALWAVVCIHQPTRYADEDFVFSAAGRFFIPEEAQTPAEEQVGSR